MKFAPVFDQLIHSLIFAELHQHVNIISILEKVFEVNDILVIQLFVNFNFLTELFGRPFSEQVLFFDNFGCENFARLRIGKSVASSESTFSEKLASQVFFDGG